MDALFFHHILTGLTTELDDTINIVTPERKKEIFDILNNLMTLIKSPATIETFTNPEVALEILVILEHIEKLFVQLDLPKKNPVIEHPLHAWDVKDVSGQKIGKRFKVNNTFGVLQRLPDSNLVVPLTLWDGYDTNPNIWKKAAPALIRSLEKLLRKRFVKRKELITRQGIAETSVTVGDRGIELAINGSLNIGPSSITMLISSDSLPHGWQGPMQFQSSYMPTPHKSCKELIDEIKKGPNSQKKEVQLGRLYYPSLSAKQEREYVRVLIYAGLLSALKKKDTRSAWVIGLRVHNFLVLDKNEQGCVKMLEFIQMVHTTIGPKKPTRFVHEYTQLLAEAYEAVGNFAAAIQCYKRSVVVCKVNSLATELWLALNNLALCYKRTSQYLVAISTYENALSFCQDAHDDPKQIIVNLLNAMMEYMCSSEFKSWTRKKKFEYRGRHQSLFQLVFAESPALHPTLKPFWDDLLLVWREKQDTAKNKGLIKADRIMRKVRINKTTKMDVVLSIGGLVYSVNVKTGVPGDIVGKWDKKKKKVVPVPVGQFVIEDMSDIIKRFAKQGITLKYKRNTGMKCVFIEILNLGRTWVYLSDVNEIVELPCLGESHTFAPERAFTFQNKDKTQQCEKEKAKEFSRTKAKDFKSIETTCEECCDNLDKKKSLKCSRCSKRGVDVFYCDAKCQRKHWPFHKQICKKMASSNTSNSK
jgi:tetratricopeptide (TPR) repeat protein